MSLRSRMLLSLPTFAASRRTRTWPSFTSSPSWTKMAPTTPPSGCWMVWAFDFTAKASRDDDRAVDLGRRSPSDDAAAHERHARQEGAHQIADGMFIGCKVGAEIGHLGLLFGGGKRSFAAMFDWDHARWAAVAAVNPVTARRPLRLRPRQPAHAADSETVPVATAPSPPRSVTTLAAWD